MTPATKFLEDAGIAFTLHSYQIEQPGENYGQDVANALRVPHDQLFKTLMVSLNSDGVNLAICIVPVSGSLNLKRAAKAHGSKKAEMADPALAEKVSGFVVGGISPFGQRKRLPCVLDESARDLSELFVSAGKRGLQVALRPDDLIQVLQAKLAALTDPSSG